MNLRTIASYDTIASAAVIQNVLEANGVEAFINDGEIVTMDWLLSQAVGGIKVQVNEDHFERALEILREAGNRGDDLKAETIDEDELTRQALAEQREDDSDTPSDECMPKPVSAASPPEMVVESRDAYARRFRLSAFFGIVFFPFAFYAIYLSLNALFGSGGLSETGRRDVFVGMFALFLTMPVVFLYLSIFPFLSVMFS